MHDIVELDDRYLGVGELAELVRQADVVLLPYDSREQVTSGVLIEAVAAGRPVVSTAFPHAIELLADGTGLLVPQRDPAALEAALRRVLSEPGLAEDLAEQAARKAPDLLWATVADRYRTIAVAARGQHGGGLVIELVRTPQVARGRDPGADLQAPAPAHRRRRAVRARGGRHSAAGARLLPRRRGPGAGGRLPRASMRPSWTTSASST